MYMLEYNFDSVFEESARLDIFRVYYRTRQNTNTTFERRFDDAPTEFVPDAHMHESSADFFRLSSRAIHAINHCLLLIDSRGSAPPMIL